MPILEKCSNCERLGGYAQKESDRLCARCKKKVTKESKESKNKDE